MAEDRIQRRMREVTQQLTGILAKEEQVVAAGAAVTSVALYCVCAGMTDERIREGFDLALAEARRADNARNDARADAGRAN